MRISSMVSSDSMKRHAAFALIAIALVSCIPSRADGDSCAFKGHLAYDVREGITPGVTGHVLKVVRFEPQMGIHGAGEVGLPEFQVHWMTCTLDRVELSGYGIVSAGDAPLTKCTVEIASSQKLSVPQCVEDPEGTYDYQTKRGPVPPNLGQEGSSGLIPLDSEDLDHKYQLLITRSSTKVKKNSWDVHHKTEIIQTALEGKISQRLVIYETRITQSICGD